MGLAISHHTFETARGPRTALVLTPQGNIQMGRREIPRFRSAVSMSPVDREIVAAAKRTTAQLVIFRGADGQGNSWGFDPTLSTFESNELAYLMLENQLATYRALMRTGVCLFVHTDWGGNEVAAFRYASEMLSRDLEDRIRDGEDAPRPRADLWILRNLSFFFTVRFPKLIDTILPDKLPMLEARMSRVRRMVEELPEPVLATG